MASPHPFSPEWGGRGAVFASHALERGPTGLGSEVKLR